MQVIPFDQVRDKYTDLWQRSQILPARLPHITAAAKLVLSHKDRYQDIEKRTGIPWFLVGCLHLREANCNFDHHLHNGDSLLQRTHNVPAGRPQPPLFPPFKWEDSALDALTMEPHALHKIKEWSIERFAYEAERYNGWGYEYRKLLSPYDWSGETLDGKNEEATGKFIRDHVFDPSVIDRQPGVMAVLKVLLELDPTLKQEYKWTSPNSLTPTSSAVGSGPVSVQPSLLPSPSGLLSELTSTLLPKPQLALPSPVSSSALGPTSSNPNNQKKCPSYLNSLLSLTKLRKL